MPPLPLRQSFELHALTVDQAKDGELERFVRWSARAVMGEDLFDPFVQFGYQLDHLVNDCERVDLALEYARRELAALLSSALAENAELVQLVLRAKASGHAWK